MSVELPDDILHLVVHQLWEARDFNALFNCALSCRRLATPAVMALYRMYETAPITFRGRDESRSIPTSTIISKWSRLWLSIILSCCSPPSSSPYTPQTAPTSHPLTLYPYASYLRVLDLIDLSELFDDHSFNGTVLKSFFTTINPTTAPSTTIHGATNGRRNGWNTNRSLKELGDLVTRSTPLVEELDGSQNGVDEALIRTWIPRLPKLTRVRFFDGVALSGCGQLLARNCPGFRTVEFYQWKSRMLEGDADEEFAEFLGELRGQSLEGLQAFGRADFGKRTFKVLAERHGGSLTELVLNDLPGEGVKELNELKGCVALRTLQLTEQKGSRTDLEGVHKGVLEEVVEWLRGCRQLRSVKLKNIAASAAILTPLCVEGSLKLEELELDGYSQASALPFYDSLHTQAETLRDLSLKSEPEEDPLRIEAVIESLGKLRRLSSLNLAKTSDFFKDESIVYLASCLRQLEEFWISGWGVGDAVFEALAGLHSLKRVELLAVSRFTCDGLLEYISQLGPGNQGLSLGISLAEPEVALADEEQELVRQTIQTKVDGRFDYNLSRDPNAESSESDSD